MNNILHRSLMSISSEYDYFTNYFTIESLENGLTVSLSRNALQYRIGGGTWKSLPAGSNTPSINKGQTLSFKGSLTPNSDYGIGTFTISKRCNLKGNIMSLLYGDDFNDKYDLSEKPYAFHKLFDSCTTIVDASELILPATTLADDCYSYMFQGCTSLTTAIELPATTLADDCYSYMFQGCTSLITAPALPATTLTDYCYDSMFRGCTSLTTAIELPATTLANSCYSHMFYGCTSLTKMVELPARTLKKGSYYCMYSKTSIEEVLSLPATILAEECYKQMFENCSKLKSVRVFSATTLADKCCWSMFNNCTSLTTVPVLLPAKTLFNKCYQGMFSNCTSLKIAPSLPAKTLAEECYHQMFMGCTSLTFAPELPATTLADSCYANMFRGCTSLTTAPVLPATTLAGGCYLNMFNGCSKLNYIKMLGTTNTNVLNCLSYWVLGVASSGTFVKSAIASIPTGDSGIPSGWTVENCYGYSDYFTIKSLEDGLTVKNSTNAMQYRIDNGSWNTLSVGTATPSVNKGKVIQFKMTNASTHVYSGTGTFTITKKCDVEGNIMSLIYGDDFIGKLTVDITYLFNALFEGCTTIQNAKNLILPATTLKSYCYYRMFFGCTSLITAPELPATTLADGCYANMFRGCTSLTSAPELLPATTLLYSCYSLMFSGCTSLTTAPELPATTLERSCCSNMFNGCTSLTFAPELPATTLAESCYYQMFKGCISLTSAPELPATTLADSCYYQMFMGCSKLNYIKMLATDISATNCLSDWVYGVASSGIFAKHPDMNEETLGRGVSGIPEGWILELEENEIYDTPYFTVRALSDGNMTIHTPIDFSPIKPSLVEGYEFKEPFIASCEIIVDIDNLIEIDYGVKSCDYFYEYGFETTPDGLENQLCIYKSDDAYYLEEGVDYNDIFFYVGKETVEGITYDKWRKAERDNENDPCYWSAGDNNINGEYYILTEEIINNSFAFSLDSINWTNIISDTKLTLTTGQEVRIKCVTDKWGRPIIGNDILPLIEGDLLDDGSANIEVYGNIMSLLYGDDFRGKTYFKPKDINTNGVFEGLLQGCVKLHSADNLILPATTLTDSCYKSMFKGCTSLTSIPNLPATYLAANCYESMFQGCRNLNKSITLSVMTLASSCYKSMFQGCRSLDSFPILPATTLVNNCYESMFEDCTSLTRYNTFPVSILASSCYKNMYKGCTSLTFAETIYGSNVELKENCCEGMFEGCTSLKTAPLLSASSLVGSCYYRMFYGCSELNSIRMLATEMIIGSLTDWVNGVAPSGTFYKAKVNSEINLVLPTGVHGIPGGWTVREYEEYNPNPIK